MERVIAQHGGDGDQSSQKLFLESHAHHGMPGRYHLREGRQTLSQREEKP